MFHLLLLMFRTAIPYHLLYMYPTTPIHSAIATRTPPTQPHVTTTPHAMQNGPSRRHPKATATRGTVMRRIVRKFCNGFAGRPPGGCERCERCERWQSVWCDGQCFRRCSHEQYHATTPHRVQLFDSPSRSTTPQYVELNSSSSSAVFLA
jgi:hypothetical protein